MNPNDTTLIVLQYGGSDGGLFVEDDLDDTVFYPLNSVTGRNPYSKFVFDDSSRDAGTLYFRDQSTWEFEDLFEESSPGPYLLMSLMKVNDHNENSIEVSYQQVEHGGFFGQHRVENVQVYEGATLRTDLNFVWNSCGGCPLGDNVVAITDGQRRSSYTYDEDDSTLTSYTDVDGETWNYTYTDWDAYKVLSKVSDPEGNWVAFDYNATTFQCEQITKGTSTTTSQTRTFVYDSGYRWVEATLENGAEDQTIRLNRQEISLGEESGGGFPTSILYPNDFNVVYTMDDDGWITKVKDGNGRTYIDVNITYDDAHNPTEIMDALGETSYRVYDNSNYLTRVRDNRGNDTKYAYDGSHNLVKAVQGAGDADYNFTTTYTVAGNGLVSKTTYPEGNEVTYGFFAATADLNHITQWDSSTPYKTTFTENAAGQQTSVTKPSGHVLEYASNKRNRVTRVTNPDVNDANTTYAYDAVGNLVAVKAPLGAITGNTYDPLSRLLRVNDALDQNTTYAYDQAGNLLSTTDPNGHMVEYEYDVMNRLVEKQDALDRNTTSTYDVGGRLTRTGFANGNAVDYTYDERGNLIKLRTDDGNYTYRYDANGNRIGAKSVPASGGMGFADENLTYTYDALNRLEYKRYRTLGVGMKSTYDGNGRRTMLEYGNDFQHVQRSEYDGLNRLVKLHDSEDLNTAFEYSCCDLLENIKLGDDLNITYGYDAADRLTRISHRYGTSNKGEFLYTLTNRDEISQRKFTPSAVTTTTDYSYDTLSRLGSAYTTSTDWYDYEYDPFTNLTRVHREGADVNFTVDAADECTEADRDDAASYPQTYDAAGNLVRFQSPDLSSGSVYDYCLTYDGLNRLTEGWADGLSATLISQAYDAEGNRSTLQYPNIADANVYYHIYDGADLLAVYKGGSGNQTTRFLHGQGIDNPLKMHTRDAKNYYYIKDRLHSVYALMEGVDGQKPITYAYSPYGQVSITRGDSTSSYNWNPFLYTGREAFNAALSIYNYRSRHYFASLGRFGQADSFPGFLTRPASLNKYMYVEGGPINSVDPTGKSRPSPDTPFVHYLPNGPYGMYLPWDTDYMDRNTPPAPIPENPVDLYECSCPSNNCMLINVIIDGYQRNGDEPCTCTCFYICTTWAYMVDLEGKPTSKRVPIATSHASVKGNCSKKGGE